MSTLSNLSLGIESYLNAQTYIPKGHEEKLSDGTQIFVGSKNTGENAVIIIPDKSGLHIGRTRGLCDFLGDREYVSVIPNFNIKIGDGPESNNHLDWYKSRTFEGKIKPTINSILNYLKSRGVERICIFGSGWGSWIVVQLLASEYAECFQCGVLTNPMIDLEEKVYGGSVPALFCRVHRPLMVLSTQPDTTTYQAFTMMLQYKLPTTGIIDYQDLDPTFLLHGSLSDDRIRLALLKAFTEIDTYFRKHFELPKEELVRELTDRFPIDELFSSTSAVLSTHRGGNESNNMNYNHNADTVISVAPYLNVNSYQCHGQELKIGDQQTMIYMTGRSENEEKCGLIIIPDLSGWNSGRLRNIGDFFGDHNWLTIIPNLQVKGMESQGFMMERSAFANDIVNPTISNVVTFMKEEQGINKIALLGFGWGSWIVTRLLASEIAEECYCAAVANPNLEYERKAHGGSVNELMSLIKRPLLVIATKDEDYYRELLEEYLLDELPTSKVIKTDAAESNYLLFGRSGSYRAQIERTLNEIYAYFQYHFNQTASEYVSRTKMGSAESKPSSVPRVKKREEKSEKKDSERNAAMSSAETAVAKVPLRRDSWENINQEEGDRYSVPHVKEQLLIVDDKDAGEQFLFSEVQDYEPAKEGGTTTTTTTLVLQLPENQVAMKEKEGSKKWEEPKKLSLEERIEKEEKRKRTTREKKIMTEYYDLRMLLKEGVQHNRELLKQVGERVYSHVRNFRLGKVGI